MSIKINCDTGTFYWFCLLALAQSAAQALLILLIIKQQHERITSTPTGLLNGVIGCAQWHGFRLTAVKTCMFSFLAPF